jgi:hypothetical protein
METLNAGEGGFCHCLDGHLGWLCELAVNVLPRQEFNLARFGYWDMWLTKFFVGGNEGERNLGCWLMAHCRLALLLGMMDNLCMVLHCRLALLFGLMDNCCMVLHCRLALLFGSMGDLMCSLVNVLALLPALLPAGRRLPWEKTWLASDLILAPGRRLPWEKTLLAQDLIPLWMMLHCRLTLLLGLMDNFCLMLHCRLALPLGMMDNLWMVHCRLALHWGLQEVESWLALQRL